MKIKIVTLISLLLFVTGIASAQIKKVPSPNPSPKVARQTTAKPSAYTLPVGTIIHVRMVGDISSASAKVNDTFSTTLIGPVMVRGIELLPAETKIQGRITKVVKASKKSEAGRMQVVFEKIMMPDGEIREIAGELISISDNEANENVPKPLKGESSKKENAVLIGGGAAIGAVIGAVANGASGAAVGAAVGAGVGTGGALVKKGNEAIVKANSELSISLKEEVTLPVKDY
jgi:hypothetical protein